MSKELSLKLMTYNIGGGRKNLGSQFPNILKIIKEEDPDILAIQEAVKWKSLNDDQFDQVKAIAESGIKSKFCYFGPTLKMQENFHIKKELFIHAVFNDCENLEQGNALSSHWPFTRLGDSNKSGSPKNIPLYIVLYEGNRETDPRYVILSRINMGYAKAFLMTTHLTTLYGERGSKQIPQKANKACPISPMNLNIAVCNRSKSDLGRISSRVFAKWSGRSRECLNPKGEFHGCSVMSIDPQKSVLSSECVYCQRPFTKSYGASYGS